MFSVITGVVNDNPALKHNQQLLISQSVSKSVDQSGDWSVIHTVSQSVTVTVIKELPERNSCQILSF